LNKIELEYPDGRKYLCATKDLVENVPNGAVYFQQAGGGGGYGDPYLRPASLVATEVKNGVISLEAATRDYGVVINSETLGVMEEETKKHRSSRSIQGV
jgi:N-methylhydantoinase B